MVPPSTVVPVFSECVGAIRQGMLILRESSHDKEFHFQDWVKARIQETRTKYEQAGRNSYPDFRIVESPEGYEVKGLAYPGRVANFDSNSQIPSGHHNGRTIFYVFGRYPKDPDGNTYPVLDLVICHGDFLNADHDYVHANKSVKGFGSYGDIMIRDRKMYVAPTPFGLLDGVAHNQTLILPTGFPVPAGYSETGSLARKEADRLIIAYTFDLTTNTIVPNTIPNPSAGVIHEFKAWRLKPATGQPVSLRDPAQIVAELSTFDDGDE